MHALCVVPRAPPAAFTLGTTGRQPVAAIGEGKAACACLTLQV